MAQTRQSSGPLHLRNQESCPTNHIGYRDVPDLQRYIAGQKEHHRKRTFEEELIHFLEEYGIEYDKRCPWN
jgi:hypothetical protein